jgi:hypothetical protein
VEVLQKDYSRSGSNGRTATGAVTWTRLASMLSVA